MNIQRHHSNNVRPVHRGKNALRPRQCTQLLCRHHDSGSRRDVAEEQHPRPVRDLVVDKISPSCRFRHRVFQLAFFHTPPLDLVTHLTSTLTSHLLHTVPPTFV